ncbi:hypothetical protein MTO96_048753 [Rhipicephalus appendiculatus]
MRADQRAVVSDDGGSSLAPAGSEAAELSPLMLGMEMQQKVDAPESSTGAEGSHSSSNGEMPEVSATPDMSAAMTLEHSLASLSTGVTGAQQSIDSSQNLLPASPGTAKPAKCERVLDLERRLDLEQKRRRKAEKERDSLRESFGRVFSSDQINVLEKGTMRGKSWSPATLQKALLVKVACGSKGYEFVRENVAPLPATRTLQRHIEHI